MNTKNKKLKVPASEIEILTEADVVVCGGGCSGVTAAVAAARHGASVVLIERWPSVGGMATNALVNGWHRSDREKMVIYGLVEESTRRAEQEGWIVKDRDFPRAHETHWFDPEGMRIIWHRLLDEAGVRTLCYTAAGEPIIKDREITAVLIDTKQGRRAVKGRIFIDCTGDGDLAAKAGVPFSYGRESDGLVQGMTLIFSLEGIDQSLTAERLEVIPEVMALMRELRDRGEFPQFNDANCGHYLRNAEDGTLWNMLPVAGNPLDEEEITKLTVESREKLVAYLKLWRDKIPGYKKAKIRETGFALGVRESRRIHGLKTLDHQMVLDGVKHQDAIGHGVWMIDIHDPKGSGYTTHSDRGKRNMLDPGTSYHIPFGMCLQKQVPNLAVAGRCASSTHEAHSSVRVQTHCMVMGQGVGTAAALCLKKDKSLLDADIRELQQVLKQDGVYIEDIPPQQCNSDVPPVSH